MFNVQTVRNVEKDGEKIKSRIMSSLQVATIIWPRNFILFKIRYI